MDAYGFSVGIALFAGPFREMHLPIGVDFLTLPLVFSRRSARSSRRPRAKFVGLGRKLNLRDIACPTYLLAGAAEDITTPEQVLDAVLYISTSEGRIVLKTVPSGHIGLFMCARTLKEHWPEIARWLAAQ